jgi:hypothetical protein
MDDSAWGESSRFINAASAVELEPLRSRWILGYGPSRPSATFFGSSASAGDLEQSAEEMRVALLIAAADLQIQF